MEDELSPRLDDAKKMTEDVEDLNRRIRDNLDEINAGLDQLPEGSVLRDTQLFASLCVGQRRVLN